MIGRRPFLRKCLSFVGGTSALASAPGIQLVAQATASRLAPFRIAVYEGGTTERHNRYMRAVVESLLDIEWITIPSEVVANEILGKQISLSRLWDILSFEQGPLLRFPRDAFYQSECGDSESLDRLLSRLERRNDIDLIIAFGDGVETLISENPQSTPVLAVGVSEHAAGKIFAAESDGADASAPQLNNYIHIDSDAPERSIRLFHNLVGFTRLGVLHGKVSSDEHAVEDLRLRAMSEAIGIDMTHCFLSPTVNCRDENAEFVKCCESLAPNVDAIYIKPQRGFNDVTVPELVSICKQNKVATFCSANEAFVKAGLLMSTIGHGMYRRAGWMVTQQLVKILNARPAEALSRDVNDNVDLAINIRTANQIGVYLPAHVIAAADEIYDDLNFDTQYFIEY